MLDVTSPTHSLEYAKMWLLCDSKKKKKDFNNSINLKKELNKDDT